ncbi:MAG: diadenylate cyclase [Pseudomonadota bacterium]
MKDLLDFFAGLRWQDTIDVILNSYILFRLYVLFRGTIVFRVLIGIAFLWFFQRITVSLGLVVTSWAIQGITAVAALLIIVLFRNEIRSVLQTKNLGVILWGFPRKTVETPIEIIVESVRDMAERHRGALLVFPGKEDLTEYTHSGIPWGGLLSKEMILSIFWPDNPVHDGAAIIQGSQVKEVGAILPLSHRKDLPSYYGTRHRAAAGLAESTDSLVIVVSEERGNIVVAQGLSMKVIRGKEALSDLLKEHLGFSEKQQSPFKKKKLELGLAALVSVLFMFGVWLSFTRGFETLITLEVPVEYVNRDPKMEVLDASPDTVLLHLSGSASLIKSLRPDQVRIRVDLGKAVAGKNILPLTKENISLSPGIHVKQVKPSGVEVTLDVLMKKVLPVQVDWVGRLSEHLILSGVTISPEKIQVRGGNEILDTLSTIYTEKVPLDDIRASGTMTVGVVLHPGSLKVASDFKDRVKLVFKVKEKIR